MTRDVEALFRKINQADLPYRVFEPNHNFTASQEAVADDSIVDMAYPTLKLVDPAAVSKTPDKVEQATETAGFLRNYAPLRVGRDEKTGSVRLEDIFAQMALEA